MSAATAQRPASFADTYEHTLVPAIFDRYARDLVERARPIGASDRILDLGCGTGIVARVLLERLGGSATIVGVDSSAPMLEKARSIAPELDFREGNAMALPFAGGSFELVLCQEMLQFVPDRPAALREVRRVLSPGGRFLVSTFDGADLAAALTEVGFTDIRVETVSLTERSVANVATAVAPS